MKQALLRVMRASGLFAAFRRANRGKILVVTYHRFSARDGAGRTSARELTEQLAYLRAHYSIVPLTAIERHLTRGDALPPAPAAITIDDGYGDAYEIAFPILRRYGAPATLFAATDFIDQNTWLWTDKLRYIQSQLNGRGGLDAEQVNARLKRVTDEEKERAIADLSRQTGIAIPASPPPDCRPLTWDQAREMAAAGIEFGSHTVTHPILPCVSRERLTRELQQSRARLERMLSREVALFCYPNGDHNPHVRNEVARAGYRLAVTTQVGLNSRVSDPLAVRRVHTDHDLTHFIQSTSGFEELKNSVRTSRRAA